MRKLIISAFVGAMAAAGIALAQTYPPPVVGTVGTADLFQDVVNGTGQSQSNYASAAQIAGVPGYVNGGVAVTAWTYTFGNSTTDYFIQPAGTLATGTLTAAASPSDGQRECFLSSQTQTALTWSANTGQTMNNAPTAGVANVPACMTFSKASATWYRSP